MYLDRLERCGLENGGNVVIAVRRLILSCGKMAVDEADGAVVEYEPDDNSSLVSMSARIVRPQNLRKLTLLPCRPPMPVLTSAASTSLM